MDKPFDATLFATVAVVLPVSLDLVVDLYLKPR